MAKSGQLGLRLFDLDGTLVFARHSESIVASAGAYGKDSVMRTAGVARVSCRQLRQLSRDLTREPRYTRIMARHPFQRPPSGTGAAQARGDLAEIPPEHAITRLYVLPAGSAAEFMAELEDETEEPTPALRALLRGAAR
jgi:hypothetical protein